MTLSDAQRAVIDRIDRSALTELLADIVNIPSPTGSEEVVASFLGNRLGRSGLEVNIQTFAPGRANVIARLPGTGGGPVVMLNGHLDTSYTGEEPELDGIGYKNAAVVIDDEWMYGNGVHNMKCAVAAFAVVAEAIVASGVDLAGDVVIAGVAGEIEKAPYGAFQGGQWEGFGVGTTYALAHGLVADMCILGEPTANTIGLSNMGVLWVRLRTHGTMAHTAYAGSAINAIELGRRLMNHLDEWISDYRERNEYDGVRPACDITAIEGGWPYRVSRVPVFCDVFVCVRIPPPLAPVQVLAELRTFVGALLDEVGTVDVDAYVSHPGASIKREEVVAAAIDRAHESVTGESPSYAPRTSYMDSSQLIHSGIPTVVYGPSGRTRAQTTSGAAWAPGQGEHTNLGDLEIYARVVAAAVVELCSTPRVVGKTKDGG